MLLSRGDALIDFLPVTSADGPDAIVAVVGGVKEARRSITVSIDPNCRPDLVGDKAGYLARMAGFAAIADIIRMSDVDFDDLHGDDDYAGRAHSMMAAGASLVVVTRGARGVQAWQSRSRRRGRRRP